MSTPTQTSSPVRRAFQSTSCVKQYNTRALRAGALEKVPGCHLLTSLFALTFYFILLGVVAGICLARLCMSFSLKLNFALAISSFVCYVHFLCRCLRTGTSSFWRRG